MTTYSYEIGLTEGGMENVQTLGIPAPKHFYRPFSTSVITGEGIKKGMGYPIARWHWGFLSKDDRDTLRTFISDLSSEVFIKTRIEDDSYAVFQCIGAWVEEEEKDAGRRMDFTLEFTHLVEVA